MKCVNCCFSDTRVLATREFMDIFLQRRRECPRCSKRFTTYEVTLGCLDRRALLPARQGARARMKVWFKRVRVVELLQAGWKKVAIAHEVGLTEARVRQIAKESSDG